MKEYKESVGEEGSGEESSDKAGQIRKDRKGERQCYAVQGQAE
jgi:hypothetical protein